MQWPLGDVSSHSGVLFRRLGVWSGFTGFSHVCRFQVCLVCGSRESVSVTGGFPLVIGAVPLFLLCFAKRVQLYSSVKLRSEGAFPSSWCCSVEGSRAV